MTNAIEIAETASNALTAQGKILDSIDQFYADDCVFIEPDGSSRSSKKDQRAHLEGFFASLTSFESATLHGQAIGDNFSVSVWNEALVRNWQGGKIVSEKYYTQG
jgi:ketosteroid isomerase-like protein